ncbi:MAG: TMEM165/GDT1 family protein [Archaeoglobaceae archaeon]
MLESILIPLVTVGLAEFGGKTQLSVLLLSSRVKRRFNLLMGVLAAFLIVDGFAILVGQYITTIAPNSWVNTAASIIFIIFGVLVLFSIKSSTADEYFESCFRSPFYGGFTLIFLSEWGDKSQIVSGLFSTQYNYIMVLAGVMIALGLLSSVAIYFGWLISSRMERETLKKLSGVLFILIGISFLVY